jgi:hypothetical protein
MRPLLGFSGAALLLTATIVTAQAKFAGTWVFDPARSQGIPEGVSITMTVKQDGDRIQTESNISSPQGQQTIPDVYVLDGKETDYTPPLIGAGSGKGKRTSTWNADKSGFDVTESATVSTPNGDGTITAKRKWVLAPDGKTLTIDVTMSTPMGEQVSKRVFTKKS